MVEINIKKAKQNSIRSNNQSARFTGSKKTTSVHIVADDSEVPETTPRGNIPWVASIYVHPGNTTTYSAKGYSKVHHVKKPRCHQAFTRVQIFSTKRMGKAMVTNQKI